MISFNSYDVSNSNIFSYHKHLRGITLHRRNIDSTRNCDALNLNTDNRSEASSLISFPLLKLFLNLSPFVRLILFRPPSFSIASEERKIKLPEKEKKISLVSDSI